MFSEMTDRRAYLKASLGAGLSLLLAACKSTKGRGDASQPAAAGILKTPDSAPPPPVNTGTALSTATDTSTSQNTQACQAAQIDLTTIPAASENLGAQCAFFGDSTSTLLVVSLPKYQHGILQSITAMLLPSGRVVAQKGIFADADIRPNTTLRPATFENLRLKGDTQIALLFKLSCSTCDSGSTYSKFGPIQISFSTTFLGKPAYGLSPSSLPLLTGTSTTLQYSNNQAMPLFTPILKEGASITQDGFTSVDPNVIKFTASGFDTLYVTDLAGNVLSTPGNQFTQVLEYPEFICYRLVSNMFYIRTFVRVY